MIFFLTVLLGVCVAVAIGILAGAYLVTRNDAKDDAEQTWERTAKKETKPPPIVVVGAPFADETPGMRELKAHEIVKKAIEGEKRDSQLTARLKRPATPEGQRKAAKVVRGKIKKAKNK